MGMAFDNGPFNEDKWMETYLLGLKKKLDLDCAVETGTYHGTTTSWFLNHFPLVYTCEINKQFYLIAMERLANHPFVGNLRAVNRSSTECLAEIIEQIRDKRVVLFLDAHWYENPLLRELEIIAESHYIPELLVIHDMYNPLDPSMGYDSYPEQGITYTYEWIKPYLDKIYGGEDEYDYNYNAKALGARRGAIFVTRKL